MALSHLPFVTAHDHIHYTWRGKQAKNGNSREIPVPDILAKDPERSKSAQLG